ncbi:hypothetical protein N406_05850 [Helicobacter pylori FD577]|uniref:hypothetical protein n=1 Tax=Helicobacter pylori TaxID=210 RepID=UPI000360DA0E|nr:hypothetical protein [Helicobacter pylori]EQL63559.1 hypothetical protein N406_05850 [Helicobacter pylori FD577]
MQLFERWQSVTDAYKSFYKESRVLINAQCGLDKNEEKFYYLKPRFFLEKEKQLLERILK